MTSLRFALNHMVAPQKSAEAFFDLARQLGIKAVEIRNDLAGNAIIDGTPAKRIRDIAASAEISILSINALQRFNEWSSERDKEARELVSYARDCGAAGLVLVPVNDGSGCGDGARQANLRRALKELLPILADAGIVGLVEPLGFAICSLRSKREAVEAIADIGADSTFRLVHDTFHHHLAGEPEFFADRTGLVHISGVTDAKVPVADMLDAHRVLVDENDRLGNIEQLKTLVSHGYRGFFSFEPFAATVHSLDDPRAALMASLSHITGASDGAR
ncbi:TIM barrel protein [Rhizobium sp. RM]|uniref:TIM barrel protein n=1 Tax=Rhizobium sp. RM TaxID=2748079 RepID=UPI00110EDEEA|nr:TIM barrel protein [Rhizobium sp. RM]NWJ27362.1 TIM barrel protein [Rhizobium sp. RM]TMV20416.1 TIM barrel protein [Rhizobium sp. Td3]